ncbi:hypothetical protein E4M02_05885 [Brevundimonas sp. S30B]|uniref:hypothetical protein n=1 Tax=unclassified Brevundimonas TaxID=2622653 RepID=UPI0010716EE4|nr:MULTISPECIES: hypothetical protein [unclassified Brevundimonas]QBX38113.1 hypothetical protein E4M01_10255 [Brevundimonas sp. MF30-B]TFW02532.1 hypothetical protein E4M02_05885 [Brevundimonas sp. S30B]
MTAKPPSIEDLPGYEAGLAAGRLQALEEVADRLERYALQAQKPDLTESVQTLVFNWRELLIWVSQLKMAAIQAAARTPDATH